MSLVALVPDGSYPVVLAKLLAERRQSLGVAPVRLEIVKDALHDSSGEAASLLRPYLSTATHVLVLRDLEGSGWEARGTEALEAAIRRDLEANGWAGRPVEVIVVEPEIEAWLRFDSAHLAELVEHYARKRRDMAALLFAQTRDAAVARHGGLNSLGKPIRPKEVFLDLLREFGIQHSNALYGWLALREGLKGCRVPSFRRLVATLQTWFPAHSATALHRK